MGLADKLKQFGDMAKGAAAEHKDQISGAVESAAVLADKRTRGKYTDKIQKATEKTAGYVDRLAPDEEGDSSPAATPPAATAAADSPPAATPPAVTEPVIADPEPPATA